MENGAICGATGNMFAENRVKNQYTVTHTAARVTLLGQRGLRDSRDFPSDAKSCEKNVSDTLSITDYIPHTHTGRFCKGVLAATRKGEGCLVQAYPSRVCEQSRDMGELDSTGQVRFMQCCTVHSQDSGIAGRSGRVRGCASVLAGVSRAHGLDSHHADSLAVSRDGHVPVILLGDRFAVQRPRHFDRQVSLHDRADRRDRLAPIRGLVADRERRDLRGD